MKKVTLIFISFFLFSSCLLAQIDDVIFKKSYNELINLFYEADDIGISTKYGKTIIIKAKRDKDTLKLSTGYFLLASSIQEEIALKYADSLIDLTKNNSTKHNPASAYLLKSLYYLDEFNFEKSLNNIVEVKKYAEIHENSIFLREYKTILGIIKIRIGDLEEALKLFEENLHVSKLDTLNGNYSNYLKDIYNISSTFNEMQLIDSAIFYNERGIELSRRCNNKEMLIYFKYNISLTDYYVKEYEKAREGFEEASVFFKAINDKINLLESQYYLGKINRILQNDDLAYEYFKKIDSFYIKKQMFYPKFRDAYYELINLSRNRNEPSIELNYINKLLKLDSLFVSSNLYLNSTITNEFDIPNLIKEKEKIIENLSHENLKNQTQNFWQIILGSLLLLILLGYQIYLRKKYKRKAKLLINELNTVSNKKQAIKKNQTAKEIPQISKEIVENTLFHLDKFEKDLKFLDSNLTLQQVAKQVKSNSKYLSKIINTYKAKSFHNYINQLRIDYVLNRLKNERKFRNFTIHAIALESGYNQSESFSKAFYKITGVKPSYFIKELKKNN